jgi:hypothetical protein
VVALAPREDNTQNNQTDPGRHMGFLFRSGNEHKDHARQIKRIYELGRGYPPKVQLLLLPSSAQNAIFLCHSYAQI